MNATNFYGTESGNYREQFQNFQMADLQILEEIGDIRNQLNELDDNDVNLYDRITQLEAAEKINQAALETLRAENNELREQLEADEEQISNLEGRLERLEKKKRCFIL